MKIINVSFFLRSLVNKKNANKFLFFINIGIFLSIFAISSALITFYTEKKIDTIEFELILQHNDKKDYNNTLDGFSQIRNILYTWQKHEKDIVSLYQYNASTILGKKLISINDIYLPELYLNLESYDADYFDLFFDEDLLNQIMLLSEEYYGKDSSNAKNIKEDIQKLEKYAYLFKKDYSKSYDKIFDYNYSSIVSDIYYGDQFFDNNNPIYIDYRNLQKTMDIFDSLFSSFEILFTDQASTIQAIIDIYNDEIIKLSKRENKIIIVAFIFQLLIFFIIQFFEITSIQNEIKKYAKRKI
tara:strand:+ start:280 stop:1176 length:897 start_codon:yes stop_codon:yes gene_type:complete